MPVALSAVFSPPAAKAPAAAAPVADDAVPAGAATPSAPATGASVPTDDATSGAAAVTAPASTLIDDQAFFSGGLGADAALALGARAEALVGSRVGTVTFEDASVPVGHADRTADLDFTVLGATSPGTVFRSLPDAVAVARRATELLSTPAGQLPASVVVKVDDHFVPMWASHPLLAEHQPDGPTGPWKPLAAARATVDSAAIAAIIDGIGNVVPIRRTPLEVAPAAGAPAPAPAPTPPAVPSATTPVDPPAIAPS